jgi:hypothetical protein
MEPTTSPTEKAIRNGLMLLTSSLGREVDAIQVRAYLRGLKNVPADVVLSGADLCIERMAAQPMGKRYFPTVADWLAACADVVDERRKVAARQAQALQEDCLECRDSKGWREVNGLMVRCTCFKRAQELLAAAGEALTRPLAKPTLELTDGAA